MASAFGHALVAVAIGKISSIRKYSLRFWLLGIFCAVIPDADVIAFKFGVPYEHVLGHRGFSHSFLVALLLAILVTELFFRKANRFSSNWYFLVIYFFLATASHGILDALTNGGLGVAFFAPFHNERYFFPWRPIQVSPIGVKNFFSYQGLRVLASEAIWVGLPSLVIFLVRNIFGKKESGNTIA